MTGAQTPIPRAVLAYGVLGLIPFLAPPLVGATWRGLADLSATVLALYGALILSFLGGARWALAAARPAPSLEVVTLAMIPTLAGLALLLIAGRRMQLLGLAAALALHGIWDMRGKDLPSWYGRLRAPLTLGAVAGLVAGAFLLAG
jgi:hypothetical protein